METKRGSQLTTKQRLDCFAVAKGNSGLWTSASKVLRKGENVSCMGSLPDIPYSGSMGGKDNIEVNLLGCLRRHSLNKRPLPEPGINQNLERNESLKLIRQVFGRNFVLNASEIL